MRGKSNKVAIGYFVDAPTVPKQLRYVLVYYTDEGLLYSDELRKYFKEEQINALAQQGLFVFKTNSNVFANGAEHIKKMQQMKLLKALAYCSAGVLFIAINSYIFLFRG